MNKKMYFSFVAVLLVSLLTPLVLAVPGDEKTNEKFEYFSLLCSGTGDGEPERFWYTPPNADPLDNKTTHSRGTGWITGDTVELTVGSETYTMTTMPINVTWTTTFDMEVVRDNDGNAMRYNLRLTDVVTVYEDNEMIGELILQLKSSIVPTRDPIYTGTVVGHGTGMLKGVHISAVDLGVVGPQLFMRVGTITGWPL